MVIGFIHSSQAAVGNRSLLTTANNPLLQFGKTLPSSNALAIPSAINPSTIGIYLDFDNTIFPAMLEHAAPETLSKNSSDTRTLETNRHTLMQLSEAGAQLHVVTGRGNVHTFKTLLQKFKLDKINWQGMGLFDGILMFLRHPKQTVDHWFKSWHQENTDELWTHGVKTACGWEQRKVQTIFSDFFKQLGYAQPDKTSETGECFYNNAFGNPDLYWKTLRGRSSIVLQSHTDNKETLFSYRNEFLNAQQHLQQLFKTHQCHVNIVSGAEKLSADPDGQFLPAMLAMDVYPTGYNKARAVVEFIKRNPNIQYAIVGGDGIHNDQEMLTLGVVDVDGRKIPIYPIVSRSKKLMSAVTETLEKTNMETPKPIFTRDGNLHTAFQAVLNTIAKNNKSHTLAVA